MLDAPRDIGPGRNWGEAIIDAIKDTRVMVLVFSSNANLSGQVLREVERAVAKGVPIVRVRPFFRAGVTIGLAGKDASGHFIREWSHGTIVAGGQGRFREAGGGAGA